MNQHKGVNYYVTYDGARVIRDRLPPGARIVEYTRGWAVQYRISGPYYPEEERDEFEQIC